MTNTSLSSSSTSTFSLVIDIKEDKENKVGEGLAEDPPELDTRAIDEFVGFSILALDCWYISVDLSLLKSSSTVSLIVWDSMIVTMYFDFPNPSI
jgi:hypothetical protein